MAAVTTARPAEQGEDVGQVYVDIEVMNYDDARDAARGRINVDEIRRMIVSHVLVDTGATHLCLPADVIERLGLPLGEVVPVATPIGTAERRMFDSARIRVEGRETYARAIELPLGGTPLLGAFPMEELGLEPDLRNRMLRILPLDNRSSYLRA